MMKTITLNGKRMKNIEGTHCYLKRRLRFPSYYGGNLDALYDVLSTAGTPITVRLIHYDKMSDKLGVHADLLIKTFHDAAEANPLLRFEVV